MRPELQHLGPPVESLEQGYSILMPYSIVVEHSPKRGEKALLGDLGTSSDLPICWLPFALEKTIICPVVIDSTRGK